MKVNYNEMTIAIGIKYCNARSAWKRGVATYANLILGNACDDSDTIDISEQHLLNGAKDWMQYSYGGYTLGCDNIIAKTLCTPSELKRTDYGNKQPNKSETWLDVQARALYQAYALIHKVASETPSMLVTES